ncbi:hypothetical protein ACI2KR_30405 [Pseudomonas luteola]
MPCEYIPSEKEQEILEHYRKAYQEGEGIFDGPTPHLHALMSLVQSERTAQHNKTVAEIGGSQVAKLLEICDLMGQLMPKLQLMANTSEGSMPSRSRTLVANIRQKLIEAGYTHTNTFTGFLERPDM